MMWKMELRLSGALWKNILKWRVIRTQLADGLVLYETAPTLVDSCRGSQLTAYKLSRFANTVGKVFGVLITAIHRYWLVDHMAALKINQ